MGANSLSSVMKIEFLTQEDPLYILPLFEEFFRNYAGECEITRVSCCPTMGNRSRAQMVRELTALYGYSGFARLLSRLAWSHLLGSRKLERNANRFYSLAQLCRAYGVDYVAVDNPNSSDFVQGIKDRHSDLIVSIACPFILKKPLLSAPPLGCINIHHAPLPRYKGMMPTFWQLYHGERTVGLTVHFMGEKLDEGDALLQESLSVEPGESLDRLICRSKRHAAHCLARVLRQLASGSATRRSLNHEKGSYFTFPTVSQIREFQKRGLRAI
jgi:methionyl-tRNA formyltransferase